MDSASADEPVARPEEAPETPRSPLFKRVVFVLCVVGALIFAQAQDFSGGVSAVVTPFILALALSIAPLVWRSGADPFEPASFNGIYSAVGLASSFASVLEAGKVDLKFIPELSPRAKDDLAGTVVWSYVVAQACYLLGYYSRGSGAMPPKPSRLAGLEWSSQRLAFASLVCFGVAVPVYVFFQSQLQGDLTDITRLAAGKAVWREDTTRSWILRGIMVGCLPAMMLLAVVLERKSRTGLVAVGTLVFVEGLLILRAAQRSLTLNFFIVCAALFHYMWRRIPVALLLVAGFVSLVFSNVLRDYRTQDEYRPAAVTPFSERIGGARALTEHEEDRQRLSTMGVIFYYFPEKKDFLLGETWYGLIAMPIPRWVWPEKVNAFVWRDSHIAVELVGAPVPIPFHGVLYANFSWFGVVLGMFGWGIFQRRFYEWAMASRADKNTAVIYVNALFVTSPMLLPLTYFTQFVLPLLIIVAFVGYRVRSKNESSPDAAHGLETAAS